MRESHDHAHDGEAGSPLSDIDLRVRALESLRVEKGLVEPAALDALIDTYETKVGPRNGARVVARAWVDPAYKARLLEDATRAVAELGYMGRQGEELVALENTPTIHNMVVCTLCSSIVLGQSFLARHGRIAHRLSVSTVIREARATPARASPR